MLLRNVESMQGGMLKQVVDKTATNVCCVEKAMEGHPAARQAPDVQAWLVLLVKSCNMRLMLL
jgi:hypothetical protein